LSNTYFREYKSLQKSIFRLQSAQLFEVAIESLYTNKNDPQTSPPFQPFSHNVPKFELMMWYTCCWKWRGPSFRHFSWEPQHWTEMVWYSQKIF